jgi:hypothetical protein
MLNKIFLQITLFIIALSIGMPTYAGIQISDYHRTFVPGYNAQGHLLIAIRMFYRNQVPYFLVVNPNTLQTNITPISSFKSRRVEPGSFDSSPGNYTMNEIQNTPYYKSHLTYSSPPYTATHYGLNHASHAVNGIFLTIDLCPSKNPFEKKLFGKLIEIANKKHQAVSIGISMTGLWLLNHPVEFDWLLHQQKNNKLKITWINHSFSHIDYSDIPYTKNFLLPSQENLEHEILDEEKLLLEHNQLPSVFFRLPGLVANEAIILRLKDFGLIPLDTDALLGGKKPVSLPLQVGSIVLVHGNGNAHKGVELLLPELNYQTNYLPITQAF